MRGTGKTRAGIYARQSHGNKKSIAEQITECTRDVEAEGWRAAGTYEDLISASRHARKARDDWPRLLGDVDAGKLDVVVMWESSRGDRTLESWAGFLELCRRKGVLIRVTDDAETYDVRKPKHWKQLATDGVSNAYYSEETRQRNLRTARLSAEAGRPGPSHAPYGYRRIYDPQTRKLVAQEPHPEQAPIVAEIIDRIANGETLASVTRSLNERGVPPPSVNWPNVRGDRWYSTRVRAIALNEAYLGVRVHNGDRHKAIWTAIVDPAKFWAAKRIVEARAGQGWRSDRAENLLTGVATCGGCGGPMAGRRNKKYGRRYGCRAHGCAYVDAEAFEDIVLAYVLGRLARPDVYVTLKRQGEDADRELAEARAEAAALRSRLKEWRQAARRGEVTPASLAEIETGLADDIAAAEAKARRAGIPPAVRELVEAGDELPQRWAAMPLAARRDVVAALVDIEVARGKRGVRVPTRERVSIEWKGTVS